RVAPGGGVFLWCRRLLTIAADGHRLVPKNPGESPVQCCAGPTMTALAGVVGQSWKVSLFPFVAVLLLMCTTFALTALVTALWCGSRHFLWFHHIGAA